MENTDYPFQESFLDLMVLIGLSQTEEELLEALKKVKNFLESLECEEDSPERLHYFLNFVLMIISKQSLLS